jgi:putative transposase
MMKNHKLAKAIQEVGFFKFKTVLSTKALQNDKKVVLIDRFYPSSKTCSQCGYVHNDLKLQDRYWCCPKCGTNHDRDYNAALNILYEGRRISAV